MPLLQAPPTVALVTVQTGRKRWRAKSQPHACRRMRPQWRMNATPRTSRGHQGWQWQLGCMLLIGWLIWTGSPADPRPLPFWTTCAVEARQSPCRSRSTLPRSGSAATSVFGAASNTTLTLKTGFCVHQRRSRSLFAALHALLFCTYCLTLASLLALLAASKWVGWCLLDVRVVQL